jgi:CheY-like chemotaxis protein
MDSAVLIAEADVAVLELMAAVLTRQGFEVGTTDDGEELLERAAAQSVCLVVCGATRSGPSGAELCRKVRAALPTTHVVLLALGEPSAEELACCEAVLARPFRYPPLKHLLEEWELLTKRDEPEHVLSFSVPVPAPPSPDEALTAVPLELSAAPPSTASSVMPLPIPLPLPEMMAAGDVAALPPTAAALPEQEESLALDVDVEATGAPAAIGAPQPAAPPAAPPLAAAPPAAARPKGPPPPAARASNAPPAARSAPPPAARPLTAVAPPAAVAKEPTPAQVAAARATATALPASLPRLGDLGTLPLPRLVFELYVATFSGIIRLARHGEKRTLYVWGGLPVRVDRDDGEDIGQLLVGHGRITKEACEAARSEAAGGDLGRALVGAGCIREAELLAALREQAEERLVDCFSWRDGTYAIEATVDFAKTMPLTEVHPVRCIFRGVSEHYDLGSLFSYFGALRERFVVTTETFKFHYETLGPFLRYLDLGRLFDGKTTFEQALRSDDAHALEIAQTLYVLLVTDMVRPARKPGEPTRMPQRTPPAARTRPVDYREITRLCDDIARVYLLLKEGDYLTALGVAAQATAAEVDAAAARLTPLTTPESLPSGLPDDVTRRAAELGPLLAHARETLRDEQQKERYLASRR